MVASNNSAHQLDEGAWVHILKRLPVKMICRFQSVCKSWKSLITSSFFTNHHFSFTSSSNCSNKPYIFFNYVRSGMFPVAYENKLILSYAFCTLPTIVKNLEFLRCPFQLSHHRLNSELTVTGVLYGIVCLSSITNSNSTTVVWNPTIHKYLIIPPSSYKSFFEHERCSGFGFDSFKNDFKVVRMFQRTYLTCEVFSFQQGLWRSVAADHIMPFSLTTKVGTFHNGFIHWIIEIDSSQMMLVFDCQREELKTMDLPPEFNQYNNSRFKQLLLDTYCGMLSVMGKSKDGMWVMEEYGVASSWKKLSKVDGWHYVEIYETSIFQLSDRNGSFGRLWEKIEDTTIKPTHRPLNGHIFEPSMFLMNENTKAMSYTMSRDRYRKVSYVKDGTQCDYIQVPHTEV